MKEEIKIFGKNKEEIFKMIDKHPLFHVKEELNISWEELEKMFERYCEEKASKLDIKEIAKIAYYSYHLLKEIGVKFSNKIWDIEWLKDEIEDLRKRLDNASWLIRHSLGDNRIKINCPICKKWGYLELKEVEVGNGKVTKWVCSNCNKIPF